MPTYIVAGTKILQDGSEHLIQEITPSRTKAEWVSALYIAEGYTVTINEQEQ